MTKKLTITICSSANFYRQAVEIQELLQEAGFEVLIPDMAETMKQRNDYEVSHYKTWFGDKNDYHKKTQFMHGHFAKVDKGDVCLVLNYEKNGKPNYIGGNVIIGMGLAMFQHKPIIILNEVPEESAYLEEIMGMQPIVMHGKVENLSKVLSKLKISQKKQ